MTYKNCKKLIENNRYEYNDMMEKLDVFLLVNRITTEQYYELVKMMDKYDKDNLLQITLEEAEEYYKQLNENYYVF